MRKRYELKIETAPRNCANETKLRAVGEFYRNMFTDIVSNKHLERYPINARWRLAQIGASIYRWKSQIDITS